MDGLSVLIGLRNGSGSQPRQSGVNREERNKGEYKLMGKSDEKVDKGDELFKVFVIVV